MIEFYYLDSISSSITPTKTGRQDRGMGRTSMTTSILYARSTSTKSNSVRVECPMVKKRSVI